MLTADLLRVRVRDGKLSRTPVPRSLLPAVAHYAHEVLEKLRTQVGVSRATILESCAGVPIIPKEHKLFAGILKTAIDRCEWLEVDTEHSQKLREELFLQAATDRKEHGFIDRVAIIQRVASARHVAPGEIETSLYGDRKDQARLARAPTETAENLLACYELAHARSVLVHARTVRIFVPRTQARDVVAIIRKLKFLGLIFSCVEQDDRFVLSLDGPLSEFGAGAKYGAAFANVVPLLEALGNIQMEARLRWRSKDVNYEPELTGKGVRVPIEPPPQVISLANDLIALSVEARVSESVIHSAQSLFAPDLDLEIGGRSIRAEIVESGSRESVFQRIDVVRALEGERIILCYPSRLRIAEDLQGLPANLALYSYRGAPNARALLARVQKLLTLP